MTDTSLAAATRDSAAQQPEAAAFSPPGLREYAGLTVCLVAYGILLTWAATRSGPVPQPEAILGPVALQLGLTAAVWLLMVGFRNYSVLSGLISGEYFRAYQALHAPPDWVERPARAFNNLMQVPTLFYLACLFLVLFERLDHQAVLLGWIYASTRLLHAVAYIGWNYLPARFGAWLASCVCLIVLWVRLLLG
ncbi:MAG: MAPEG family protein [Acidobacteria bacterium]|nr:MAG: MAPEG family protein [Acidobacteriota bacterium]REK08535.1 MAG: MAPEG family protein [Acidobacteriota bacterium]